MLDGYDKEIKKSGLNAYVVGAGANGALMFFPKAHSQLSRLAERSIARLWRHYWFAMVNRGVMAQPYWWDEQWTISVAHTEADIDRHLATFAEIAPALAKAQKEPHAVTRRTDRLNFTSLRVGALGRLRRE